MPHCGSGLEAVARKTGHLGMILPSKSNLVREIHAVKPIASMASISSTISALLIAHWLNIVQANKWLTSMGYLVYLITKCLFYSESLLKDVLVIQLFSCSNLILTDPSTPAFSSLIFQSCSSSTRARQWLWSRNRYTRWDQTIRRMFT